MQNNAVSVILSSTASDGTFGLRAIKTEGGAQTEASSEYDGMPHSAIAAGDSLNKIFVLLRSHTGIDFTDYKHATIRRRIKWRMVLNQIELVKKRLGGSIVTS